MRGLTREENRSGVTAAPALRAWEAQPLPVSGRLCPLPLPISLNQSLAQADRLRCPALLLLAINLRYILIYSNLFLVIPGRFLARLLSSPKTHF